MRSVFFKLALVFFLALGVIVYRNSNPAKASGGASSEPILENIFVGLADKVVPSVVNISSIYTVKNPVLPPDEFFKYFFGDLRIPKNMGVRKAMSLGSGFIIDPSGIILTNNHVVFKADEIKIQFTENSDDLPVEGKVVGRDPELDIALIKVNPSHALTALTLGNSDQVRVGEYVMAVGNPFGQGHSASHGIVSAKGRLNPEFPIGNYIQTDAPINPGNSGGPLVNLDGQVIGINTAIQADAQGIGFAITSNLIRQVLPQLQASGIVERGYIGILVGSVPREIANKYRVSENTPVVTAVAADGPARVAGMRESDIILDFDNHQVQSPNELISRVANTKIGSNIPIKILRKGHPFTLNVEVGKRPLNYENNN